MQMKCLAPSKHLAYCELQRIITVFSAFSPTGLSRLPSSFTKELEQVLLSSLDA